eukprot:Hpha_TRINITY_DN11186_c0_g1::TRINITY_DN11186_c0_g1_i1::g.27787::m.27787
MATPNNEECEEFRRILTARYEFYIGQSGHELYGDQKCLGKVDKLVEQYRKQGDGFREKVLDTMTTKYGPGPEDEEDNLEDMMRLLLNRWYTYAIIREDSAIYKNWEKLDNVDNLVKKSVDSDAVREKVLKAMQDKFGDPPPDEWECPKREDWEREQKEGSKAAAAKEAKATAAKEAAKAAAKEEAAAKEAAAAQEAAEAAAAAEAEEQRKKEEAEAEEQRRKEEAEAAAEGERRREAARVAEQRAKEEAAAAAMVQQELDRAVLEEGETADRVMTEKVALFGGAEVVGRGLLEGHECASRLGVVRIAREDKTEAQGQAVAVRRESTRQLTVTSRSTEDRQGGPQAAPVPASGGFEQQELQQTRRSSEHTERRDNRSSELTERRDTERRDTERRDTERRDTERRDNRSGGRRDRGDERERERRDRRELDSSTRERSPPHHHRRRESQRHSRHRSHRDPSPVWDEETTWRRDLDRRMRREIRAVRQQCEEHNWAVSKQLLNLQAEFTSKVLSQQQQATVQLVEAVHSLAERLSPVPPGVSNAPAEHQPPALPSPPHLSPPRLGIEAPPLTRGEPVAEEQVEQERGRRAGRRRRGRSVSPAVAAWLASVGHANLSGLFGDHEVDTASIYLLTEDDLQHMGVPIGPRKTLAKHIRAAAARAAALRSPPGRKGPAELALAQGAAAHASAAVDRLVSPSRGPRRTPPPPPPTWETHRDPRSGAVYYHCPATGESRWHPPTPVGRHRRPSV